MDCLRSNEILIFSPKRIVLVKSDFTGGDYYVFELKFNIFLFSKSVLFGETISYNFVFFISFAGNLKLEIVWEGLGINY